MLSKFMRTLHRMTGTGFLALVLAALAYAPVAIAQDAAPAPAAVKKETSAWDMIKHGGPTLIILGICSVFTMTVIIERFMFYRKATGNTDDMLNKIKQAGTMSQALQSIEHAPGVSGRVMRKAIQACRDGYSIEDIEKLVEGEVTKELIQMEKLLPQLDSMVTMCPLIGLLGTTLGMISSFSIVAAKGMSDPTELAGGISEALVNTAAGLMIAVPALFAYNYFTGRKEAILMDMEKGLSELMVILKASSGH
jgi:biopolymer transport protein ExbB